jgi:hypothetical protein
MWRHGSGQLQSLCIALETLLYPFVLRVAMAFSRYKCLCFWCLYAWP